MPYLKQYIRLVTFQKSEKSDVRLPRNAKKCIFFTTFSPFLAQKKFSCKTAYAIFKVVYQAVHIPKIRKIYGLVAETCSKTYIFHTFFAIFGPKNFFLAKLPMPYLKQYIRLVTYQKSENLWCSCQEMLKNAYFSHLFRHFQPKKFFFQKSGFVSFLEPQKATLIPKTMEWFERNPSGRTDVRTDAREQIYSPSQILWVGPIKVTVKKCSKITIKVNGLQ